MSVYAIEIDETKLAEQISGILNSILNNELRSKYTYTGKEISAAVKDLVYTNKDEILDRVVDKAVKELVRKGLPKLMERME